MLTKNGTIILGSRLFAFSQYIPTVTQVTGTEKSNLARTQISDTNCCTLSADNNFSHVGFQGRLGIGDSAENANDYNLTTDIEGTDVNTLFTYGLPHNYWTGDYNNNTMKFECTFTYTGTQELTIKEVGLFICLGSSYGNYLITRKVLSTPITVSEAGQTITFDFELDFNSILM